MTARLPMRPVLLTVLLALVGCGGAREPAVQEAERSGEAERFGPLAPGQPVRGWTILTDSLEEGLATLAAAPRYDINHLQISHEVVHDLRHLRDARRKALADTLTAAARAAGIQEVVLWDHAFYPLDYYPERFRTGPGGTLDLDDDAFWAWFKADYRALLDLAPDADGVVLTFIETGARAERQHSERLATPAEKLAAVVNAVADVVVGERGQNLYARAFSYTEAEYANVIAALERIERPEVRLMMKETPHDFFLTHPPNAFPGRIPRPTLVEFDAAGEFSGQGIIANTWPDVFLERARTLLPRDHVIGYVARTDRYGDTGIVDHAGEVNLAALAAYVEDPAVTADAVTDAFITERYGAEALPFVKPAFARARAIVTATLYTLGTNTTGHSALNYEPYASSYHRHVSGKWLDPPVAHVGHGVDRSFHLWRDVVNALAPAWVKADTAAYEEEVPDVLPAGWLTPGEQMTEAMLGHVLTEKAHGVRLAEEALASIEAGRDALAPDDYTDLRRLFERTLLTAQLHEAVAAAYFGFRVWARGGAHRTPSVEATVRRGLDAIPPLADAIQHHPEPHPEGQWSWFWDAVRARQYYAWITEGWPAETKGFPNEHAGLRFPMN